MKISICRYSPQRFAKPLAVLLFLVLSGCADLSAVRSFAKQSSKLDTHSKVLKEASAYPEQLEDLYKLSKLSDELPQDSLDKLREDAKSNYKRANYHIKLASTYMSLLGDLASDSILPSEKSVKSIVDKSVEINFISESDKGAAKKLGVAIVSLATNAMRAKHLAKHVKSNNTAFTGNLDVIKQILENLSGQLILIESNYRSYYGLMISKSCSPPYDCNPGLLSLIKRKQVEDLAKVDTTMKATAKLLKVISTIRTGYTHLESNVDDIKNKKVLRQLKDYSEDIRTGWKAIADLT